MKALTVRQPWAWAIIHGDKLIENRTTRWQYRGPLAIHAGAGWSARGEDSWVLTQALESMRLGHPADESQTWAADGADRTDPVFEFGAIIGIVELVDVHTAMPDCCSSPWAEQQYRQANGTVTTDLVHLVLEDPRALASPVPCAGRLGLWDVPEDLLEELVTNG